MPIYEYVCTECDSEIEVIQRFSDPPLEKCSRCAGKLRKKISASTFHLKGSGWYVTDYARKASGANGGNGKTSKESAESASTESKPADTVASKSEPAKAETTNKESSKTESGKVTA